MTKFWVTDSELVLSDFQTTDFIPLDYPEGSDVYLYLCSLNNRDRDEVIMDFLYGSGELLWC